MDFKYVVNAEQQYLLEETYLERINKNNIPVRPYKSQQETKKLYMVYVEELIYLIMVSDIPSNKIQSSQNVGLVKNKVLAQIYSGLSQKGYDCFDFVWFYLKIRKASKILYRNPVGSEKNELASFKIFKNTEEFKQNKSSQLIAVVKNNLLIKSILNPKVIEQNSTLKLYICGCMDGIAVKVGQTFKLAQLDKQQLQI